MLANVRKTGFGVERARPMKIMFNVGACLDIPTGRYVRGKHGEHILNGGMPNLLAMTGIGNSFKSTILHYYLITTAARMMGSYCSTYDTEANVHEWRLSEMSMNVQKSLGVADPVDFIADGTWTVTDKSKYSANKWWESIRHHLKDKVKNEKDYQLTTPFLDRDGSNLKVMVAGICEIDSFSEFTTDAVEKMQDESEIGESGQNAISLKQGQHKNQLLMELPGLSVGSDAYFMLVAHIGDEYQLDPRKPPTKKLSEIPQGKKLKGVPEKFTYVMQIAWWNQSCVSLINAGTKEPEFPRDEDDDKRGDTDLKLVTMRTLRGKSGPTGIPINLVISQNLGLLPSLTEFYNIKECGRFGIEGSLQSYSLTLLPDVKMSRKTVRKTINDSPKLRRALNITSELCQMHDYWFNEHRLMSAKELYDGVKNNGYDWDFILENTRGYWVYEEDDRPNGLFLSTMDLLLMAKGQYHPYWLEADKKTVKAKYAKLLPKKG